MDQKRVELFVLSERAKKYKFLIDAQNLANEIFFDVLKRVQEKKEDFLCSTASPQVIGELILDFAISQKKIFVNLYRVRNRRVMGYFTSSKPFDIFLNENSFPRRIESLVSTFYHELVHAVDSQSKVHRFGHGNNRYMPWKENTAPYWIDNVAHQIACERLKVNSKNLRFDVVETSPIWSFGLIVRNENHLKSEDE